MSSGETLSQEERELLAIINDPVLWAEATLRDPIPGKSDQAIKLRWYQKNILRDKSLRKACRMGRRTGKCVYAHSKINTVTGLVDMEEFFHMERRPDILTVDVENMTIKPTSDYMVWENGEQDIYSLRTQSGRETRVTDNHPFLLNRGGFYIWTELQDLRVGDKIAVPATYEYAMNGIRPPNVLQKRAKQQNSNEIVHGDFIYGMSLASDQRWSRDDTRREVIMKLGRENIFNFLSAYYLNAGEEIEKRKFKTIALKSGSYDLAKDLSHLFLRVGIRTCIEANNGNYYTYITDKKDLKLFLNITSVKKEAVFRKNPFPQAFSHLKNIANTIFLMDKESRRHTQRQLKPKHKEEITWERIVSIEKCGRGQTYDVSVPETNTLITDDIISHNTTTMVIHILWFAYTNEESKQLLSAPYKSQIDLSFEMIRAFLRSSPGLQGSVVSDTKNPQKIVLSNGAQISGFTAGTKSGNKGGSMRGQAADWIYLDEVDYLDDESFKTITAVAIERPDIGIWVSSTPSGRRAMFWRICTGKITKGIYDTKGRLVKMVNAWKEFHHPSSDNPNWNQAMEQEFREMFDEETYKHEVCLLPSQLINAQYCYKAIEDLDIGDLVLTHKNRYREVVKKFKRPVNEEVFKISCGKEDIIVTHNHPVYILGEKRAKWVRAAKVKVGDKILCLNKTYHKHDQAEQYKNYTLAEVTAVNTLIYQGFVYNVEVKEDNSYCVQGKIVHNCAEFGEETIGVFSKLYIDAAQKNYTYEEKAYAKKHGPRILGSDWDKYASASQLVIMEYDPMIKKFQVILRQETPKSEFTLSNAVNNIIHLNEAYDLDYIYVDRGYGEHQIETLRKYGLDHPETGLAKKVFGVHFGESQEIRDPLTKKKRTTPIKPFMVNQLTVLFEMNKVIISSEDEMIIKQLESYQVVKRSVYGQPIYTSVDDHALDCMFLCTLGYVNHYPEIISDIFVIKHAKTIAKVETEKEKSLMDEIVDEILEETNIVQQVRKRFSLPKRMGVDAPTHSKSTPKQKTISKKSFKRRMW